MRKKIEKRKSKNWGDMDKLDDSLNKMEVLTKHLNELVEELNSLIDAQVSLQNITYHKHMENVVHTHLIGDALSAISQMARLIRMSEKYRAMIQKLHLNLKLKIRELV